MTRYEFPLARLKTEGTWVTYDDVFISIDSAILLVEASRMSRHKKREVVGILKAARDEIGHLRWEAKAKHGA